MSTCYKLSCPLEKHGIHSVLTEIMGIKTHILLPLKTITPYSLLFFQIFGVIKIFYDYDIRKNSYLGRVKLLQSFYPPKPPNEEKWKALVRVFFGLEAGNMAITWQA